MKKESNALELSADEQKELIKAFASGRILHINIFKVSHIVTKADGTWGYETVDESISVHDPTSMLSKEEFGKFMRTMV